jgi:hypothetical protein
MTGPLGWIFIVKQVKVYTYRSHYSDSMSKSRTLPQLLNNVS